MKDAVETEPNMSHIRSSVGHQISDKISLGLDLLFYLKFGLFENTPFGEVAINDLQVVVFSAIVDLDISEGVAGSL